MENLMISPIFNRISLIYSIVDNIANSGILLNTWKLLLLTPYFIAESIFTLKGYIIYFLNLRLVFLIKVV